MKYPLALDDFELVPSRGTRALDFYAAKPTGDSCLGPIRCSLIIAKGSKPDAPTLDLLNEQLNAVLTHESQLADAAFEAYQEAAEDEHWFKIMELPADVEKPDLRTQLTGPHVLSTLNPEAAAFGEMHYASVSLGPTWDEEHGLYFRCGNHGWSRVEY